jgi:thiamine biosynthesis lipoprotein ApbE
MSIPPTRYLNGCAAAVALLMIAFSIPPLSCTDSEEPQIRQTFVMGTRGTITIYGLSSEAADSASAAAVGEMHRIESVMSTWRNDSEISRLNRNSLGMPVKVSAELFHLLEEAVRFSELTGGGFDVTAMPIVRAWGFQGGEPKLPTDSEIEEILSKVGWRKMILDARDTTVTLTDGAQIDLAGIGKGYAVDRCSAILEKRGVENALVDLGGNMFALGSPPGREAWSIGIRDPENSSGIIGRLLISDEGVATSGNYENFVVIEGRRYGHLIDPRTGRAVDHLLGVTVVAASALAADALSTGLFVLGPEQSKKAIEAEQGVRAVFALPGDIFELTGDFSGSLELYE